MNIENNIKDINLLYDNIKKCKNEINLIVKFNDEEDKNINSLLDNIKTLGIIDYNNYKNNFIFKVCPESLNDRKYEIKEGNIITYIGKIERTTAIICENKLENYKEYKWKIKILKSKNKFINVGVAPIDIDITNKKPYKYGWYLNCNDSTLYSGPPYNYNGKGTKLKIVKEEIIIVLDMNKRTIKFIIDNEDKGESYTNIPIEKPLTPVVTLYSLNDSIQLVEI